VYGGVHGVYEVRYGWYVCMMDVTYLTSNPIHTIPHTHTCRRRARRPPRYTHTHTHIHTHTHTYIHSHTHTHTHTYIHSHTHIHTHTCIPAEGERAVLYDAKAQPAVARAVHQRSHLGV
jgi:hypothetical protein